MNKALNNTWGTKNYILILIIFLISDVAKCQYMIDINKTFTIPPSCNCTFTYEALPFKMHAYWPFKDTIICDIVDTNIFTTHLWAHSIRIQKQDFPNYQYIESFKIYLKGQRSQPLRITTNLMLIQDSSGVLNIQNSDSLQYFDIGTGNPLDAHLFLYVGVEPLIQVDVKYKIPIPCTDTNINYIDNMTSDLLLRSRSDFHEYWDEVVVCEGSKSNCSKDIVWSFIKTKQSYQVAVFGDFPIGGFCFPYYNSPINIINKALQTVNNSSSPEYNLEMYNKPIVNCSKLNIDPTLSRKVIGGMIFLDNIPLSPLQDILIGDDCNSSIQTDPVLLVIDNENYKITNYTLPGHILYPGKVERYLVQDQCSGQIRIVTHGIGFTTCGDNFYGMVLADVNECVGKYIFNNVSKRLKTDFNKK